MRTLIAMMVLVACGKDGASNAAGAAGSGSAAAAGNAVAVGSQARPTSSVHVWHAALTIARLGE